MDPVKPEKRWRPFLDVLLFGLWPLQIGVAGFLTGFLGPIALTPGANQGPLLGIFITGPAGFVLGLLLGTIGLFFQRRHPRAVFVALWVATLVVVAIVLALVVS